MAVRLHNILRDRFIAEFPQFEGLGEVLYQQSRRKVSGILQQITYNEFLPRLLGSFNLPPYTGYKENVDPTILKEFSTVAYRLGHGMVQNAVADGSGGAAYSLNDVFFAPSLLTSRGIEHLIEGAVGQNMKTISTEIVDELRNTLFGPPAGVILLDLAALNIQRGRDLGIPDYNTLRADYGLPTKATWADVTSDVALQAKLSSVYPTPSDADPWVAGLAEPHVIGGAVGELFATIIRTQFIRIRDGDRYWFENDPAFRDEDIAEIKSYTLARMIEETTGIVVSGSAFDV